VLSVKFYACGQKRVRSNEASRNSPQSDCREKTDPSEMDYLGKDPEDLHRLFRLVNPSRKPMAAGEKEEKADNHPVFEPSRKICRITHGDARGTSKTQSKSSVGDRKILRENQRKSVGHQDSETQRQQ
jgi:hypothetical protein